MCAALARRARRRRETARQSGVPWRPVSDEAADTAAILGRFEAVPALESFESANRMLGRVVNDFDTATKKIRAVCVGPEGVAFVLAAPDHDAPEGFDPSADGTRWVVPHSRLDAVEAFYPAVPVALPVGTDDDGTWLVALQPGEVLPVLGESADALCRAARAGQEAWSWCDLVVVTDDPADPAFERAERAVFFGDPADLDPRRRGTTAVVTTTPVAPSDLTVLVDRHGASIHPIGRVVRPQLLDSGTSRTVHELTSPDDGSRDPAPAVVEPNNSTDPRPCSRARSTCACSPPRRASTAYAKNSRRTGPGAPLSWWPTSRSTIPTR